MKVYSLIKISTKAKSEKRLTYMEGHDLLERWYNETTNTFVIPEGFTHITEYGLDFCKFNLECLVLPQSIVWIDKRAFDNCGKLKEIKVDPDNKYFCIRNGALCRKNAFEIFWEPQVETMLPKDSTEDETDSKPLPKSETDKGTGEITDKQLDAWLQTAEGQAYFQSLFNEASSKENVVKNSDSDIDKKTEKKEEKKTEQEEEQNIEQNAEEENESDNSFWVFLFLVIGCALCVFLSALG